MPASIAAMRAPVVRAPGSTSFSLAIVARLWVGNIWGFGSSSWQRVTAGTILSPG